MTAMPPSPPDPARRVRRLFVANLVWFAITFLLLYFFGSNAGGAAAAGLPFALLSLLALVVGSIVLGIRAFDEIRRYPRQATVRIKFLAWLIILTPALLAIGSLLYVLIPRHHS